ncbi:MAG: von Willebrand factor type A domain-containing protein, partial [Chitinophagales bacterium]
MKATCHIFLLILFCSSVHGQQFYIRGEVKDESGNALQNVKIIQHRTGFVYRTGTYGSFGIVTNYQTDTLSFSLDGYQREEVTVNADNYVNVKLKLLPASVTSVRRDKLSSLTKDLEREEQKKWFTGDETYASLVENHFINARKFPVTGMSLDIDRASYSNIRR